MNKKGMEMWNVIVTAVLAIIILVVLILLISKGVTPGIEKLLGFADSSV